MRHTRKRIFVLFMAALAAVSAELARAEPVEKVTNCNMESIQASFKAAISSYRVEASCATRSTTTSGVGTTTNITIPWHWSSQGFYDPQRHFAREDVVVSGYSGSATATTTLSCPTDPWLGSSLGGGKVACTNVQFNSSGDVMVNYDPLAYLQSGFLNSQLPNSTGFQYTRASLIMQRDAELKAEQEAIAAAAEAARQKQNKRLHQAVKPAPPVIAPAIVSPTANALFMQNAVVPIKLFPPQGMQVSGFMVKLERRDGNGNWVVVTTLPIGIGEATSPTGYTGWGAPGNGRDPSRMVSLPGSYRISAQVSSPRQTLWSAPVPFAVTSPQKTIQKAPKMFSR
jgi:hypothetical protein